MLANWTVRRFLTAALNELRFDAEVGVAYVLQHHALSVEKSAVQRHGGAAHFGAFGLDVAGFDFSREQIQLSSHASPEAAEPSFRPRGGFLAPKAARLAGVALLPTNVSRAESIPHDADAGTTPKHIDLPLRSRSSRADDNSLCNRCSNNGQSKSKNCISRYCVVPLQSRWLSARSPA